MRTFRVVPSIVVAVAAFLLAVTGPIPSARASVVGPPAPLELHTRATEVFVGRVTSVGKETMQVEVLQCLKGTATGTVEVSPIYQAECCVGRDDERKPMYAVGHRILVAAVRTRQGLEIYGNRFGNQDLGDDAGVAREVAFSKEMLRIAALPTDESRRAAMVGHLMSTDPAYVEAVQWFQFSQLDEPEESRPVAKSLVAALDAPTPLGRKVAARALLGVAAPEAYDRLVEMTTDADIDTARAAASAVAAYDTDAAVDVVTEAADDPRDGGARRSLLMNLALSPRRIAHERLHEMLQGPHGVERRIAFQALGQRVARVGATERDLDDLLDMVRRGGIAGDNPYDYGRVLEETKSLRVAKALVEVVRDEESGSVQRAIAYQVLSAWTTRGQMEEVFELVRANEAVFIERLRRGGKQMHLFWVLGAIHTDAAEDAVEWAEESHPDEGARADARRTLESWDYWVEGK